MLTSNNGGYNNFQNNSNNSDKPKTNFRYGTIKTSDGKLEAGIWVSQYGITSKLLIRQAVGKDPSTNAPIYENKSPMELPQGLLDREKVQLFIRIIEENDYQNLNFQLPGTTTITVASENNNVKITLANSKTNDTRSITLEGFSNNGKVFNAPLYTLVQWYKIAYKKALTYRIDDADSSNQDEEVPFQ